VPVVLGLLLAVLVPGLGLLPGDGALLAPAAAASAPAADTSPLSVTIDSINPSFIPRKGPIRVTGSVTNEDDAPWTAVQVFGFLGGAQPGTPQVPMRTSAELASAAQTDPAAYVGDRITAPGTYETLDRIDPGQSQQFSITIPRSKLDVTEPGVYWFGVHALGDGPDGRVAGADGRARTFLPLMNARAAASPVDTALVLPLRRKVTYAADGSVENLAGWNNVLQPGGRLRAMVDFGAAAGDRPLTWLVDPGLPDVVRSLTLGNPPRSLAPPSGSEGGGSGSPSPSPSASPTDQPAADPDASDDASPSASGGTGGTGEPSSERDAALTAVAGSGNAWLDRLHEALDGNQILALPYGDVDAAAAAEHDPALLREARQRSGTQLAPWGLPMSPGLAAPDGYLPLDALRHTPRRATVLLSDHELAGAAPAVARVAGHKVVTVSEDTASGGPGPDNPRAPLAIRQRILAEAAVRVLEGQDQPLVVLLPSGWAPDATTGFFEGLDVPWLRMTTVADIASRRAEPVPAASVRYTRSREAAELDAGAFSSARALMSAGATLQDVLGTDANVGAAVTEQAMGSLSFDHRRHPVLARHALDRSRDLIDQQLRSISIDAPQGVTLSSASGRFSAILSNSLDHKVTVHVQAMTGRGVRVEGPQKIDIGPRGSTTVLLTASTARLGVHNITLVVTDSTGVPLGSSVQLPVRSVEVSKVIWFILGTGVALLFGAIALRLVRRVRAARGARS
jgi:hypothetical protein